MKQKYHIRKDVKEKTLTIQEFAVLTASAGKPKYPEIQDDEYSLLCEQTYHDREVKKASSTGKEHLIMLLRNQHFFPIGAYMDKIADVVMNMYASKGEGLEDLVFDDKAILAGNLSAAEDLDAIEEEIEEETETVDSLIEDNSPEKLKKTGKNKNSE